MGSLQPAAGLVSHHRNILHWHSSNKSSHGSGVPYKQLNGDYQSSRGKFEQVPWFCLDFTSDVLREISTHIDRPTAGSCPARAFFAS